MTVKAEIRRAMLYKDPNDPAEKSMPAISTGSGGQSEMNIKIKTGAGAQQKEGDLLELIGKKADKEELTDLWKIKTNKQDSELQMKAIDIMHR